MARTNLINPRTINALYDMLASLATVRSIEEEFEIEGVLPKQGYEPRSSGQRRSTAERYLAALDLTKPEDVERLLRVITAFVIRSGEAFDNTVVWNRLRKLMELDGYEFRDRHWQSKQPYHYAEVDQLVERYGAHQVERDWSRALSQLSSDPEGAITAARSMLESTCKWILDDLEQSYPTGSDLPALYKLVAGSLRLSPDQHGEEVFRQILGSIAGVVGGMAALRNAYGDAHGKGRRYYRPASRHARLALNLAGSLATFIAETYVTRQGEPPLGAE